METSVSYYPDSVEFLPEKGESKTIDRKQVKRIKRHISSKLKNPHMLYPHLHLKWSRFIKEQQEAFESAHRKHLNIIDKAQHEDMKKNRYKVFLGGSLVVLPVGWILAHTLLFLPQTWATLVGGSIIYFIRGEIIVQRVMDHNRDCYSLLKKINEDFYLEKKEEIEQIDVDGHHHILEEFQYIDFDLDEEEITELVKLANTTLPTYSLDPSVSDEFMDKIIVNAIETSYQKKLEKIVDNIAVNNVKRWQKVLFPGLDMENCEA